MSDPDIIPRYITPISLDNISASEKTDIIIIGGGIAGLTAGIEAAKKGAQVQLFVKDDFDLTNTYWAQGGIAACINEAADIKGHVSDTISAGKGLSDPEIVSQIITKGPELIEQLIGYGCNFDKKDSGINLTREGGHGAARILHARGDATGSEIEDTLHRQAKKTENLTIKENIFVLDLITGDNGTEGIIFLEDGQIKYTLSSSVILASGSACRIYRETTNPVTATGDGHAMAFRAGAVMRDMEFVQFHPTVLYIAGAPRSLITEAVRGEGAKLVNRNRKRFMAGYHEMEELAPRDVVSRAIRTEMFRTGDTSCFLDLSDFSKDMMTHRFPKITALCKTYGLNPAKDLIPVRPAAHYFIGGVQTDNRARTNIKGLYACGEVASTCFHGANRLGSNSLLEGLVMGHYAGIEAAENISKREITARPTIEENTFFSPISFDVADLENSIKSLSWRQIGLGRKKEQLEQARKQIEFWMKFVLGAEIKCRNDIERRKGWELKNMLTVTNLVAMFAEKREETRGVHYRIDFPEKSTTVERYHLKRGEEIES